MLKHLITSFFAKSLVAFSAFAILLVQSRQLGGATVGQVGLLITNLAIIQTISDIYTGPALVYFIPKFTLAKIYRNGVLWTLVCVFLINWVFYLYGVGVKELWLHVLILSFLVTLNAFHTVILLAKEKLTTYNFLIFFQPLLLFAALCVAVFAMEMRSVMAYIAAAYVSWGLTLTISSVFVVRQIARDTVQGSVSFKDIFRNGVINQLGNLAHILSNRYNYYMIGVSMLVGVYASATSLIESVWILSGSISPIVLTHIANQKDVQNNGRITLLLSKISFLLSCLCVLVVLFLPESFFTFLLGKDFSGTKEIMLYLSPGVLFLSFSSIISHYFSGLGKQRILLLANASGLLVTLCTSYYFISRFGMRGAAYAASLSYMVQAIVLTGVFMKQNGIKLKGLFDFKEDFTLLFYTRK